MHDVPLQVDPRERRRVRRTGRTGRVHYVILALQHPGHGGRAGRGAGGQSVDVVVVVRPARRRETVDAVFTEVRPNGRPENVRRPLQSRRPPQHVRDRDRDRRLAARVSRTGIENGTLNTRVIELRIRERAPPQVRVSGTRRTP